MSYLTFGCERDSHTQTTGARLFQLKFEHVNHDDMDTCVTRVKVDGTASHVLAYISPVSTYIWGVSAMYS